MKITRNARNTRHVLRTPHATPRANHFARLLAALALCSPLAAPVAFAAHPLVSDDTGTQGDGNWQLELNGEGTTSQPDIGHQAFYNATVTRGVGEALDLYVNAPYTTLQHGSDTLGSGLQDIELGAKWRIYETETYSLGLKPFITLPNGNDARGLGNGRVGGGFTVLNQYKLDDDWTFLANAGLTYQPNTLGQRSLIWRASGAVLYQVLPTTKLILDVGASRNTDGTQSTPPAFAIVGAIYSPYDWVDLDVGYRRGLNRQTYTASWMAGLTVRW